MPFSFRRIASALTGTSWRWLAVPASLTVIFTSPASAQDSESIVPGPADTVVGRRLEAPTNTLPVDRKFWWSDAWYDRGIVAEVENHAVIERPVTYVNDTDGTEISAILFRPDDARKYPGVLFQHGRRGLDEFVQRLARRIAARGFVVLAPDVFTSRFIEPYPIEHKEITESDVNAGVSHLLTLPDISTSKICLVSHTRGGYYTLKVATAFRRQETDVACYVSFYPHWQDPNAGEPMQVYRYAPEIDDLKLPTLVFIGEYEQYQRRRSIEMAVASMKREKRDVRLIIYPGVGRGFDFRPPNVRTFADDLATRDSNLRTAAFLRAHLSKWNKE